MTKERAVPGKFDIAGRRFRYLEVVEPRKLQMKMPKGRQPNIVGEHVDHVTAIHREKTGRPNQGGLMYENYVLQAGTPDAPAYFYAISFKGDMEGWQGLVERYANYYKVRWGRIEDDQLILSDGKRFKLADLERRDLALEAAQPEPYENED
jgi:hypothetical protein